MIATKTAALLGVGVAIGAGGSAAAGVAGEQTSVRSARSTPRSTATVTLSGHEGRYLSFTGRGRLLGPFEGRLAFHRAVTTGTYKLRLTLENPEGRRTHLVYDIRARKR